MDLILESPVKGVVTAAEFCIGRPLASRLGADDHAGGTARVGHQHGHH